MNGAPQRSAPRRAFTLVELILAVGLLSLLILALVRLIDTSLTIWGRTEENREMLEVGGAVLDLFAGDIHALEGGPRGDLVGDWWTHDVDRVQLANLPWARLRLVRHVAASARAQAGAGGDPRERDLVEVCWALLPNPDAPADERPLGVLWRGERALDDEGTLSFFDEGFFGPSGKALPGSLHEVTGGVLWFEVWYATQTSVLHQGWELGDALDDCAASWDAWRKERPALERTILNEPPGALPRAKDVPLLPRRVKLLLELERADELRFRTRLAVGVSVDTGVLDVRDGRRVPPRDSYVLVDEEWMRVLAVSDNRVSVERGRRATRAVTHEAGALVHHGWPVAREVPVAMTREDWDL